VKIIAEGEGTTSKVVPSRVPLLGSYPPRNEKTKFYGNKMAKRNGKIEIYFGEISLK
jgi:hypothetical protein